ncbi:hypothetical protein ACEQ8H_001974 [Pleosporales sp. CAS-2024a]
MVLPKRNIIIPFALVPLVASASSSPTSNKTTCPHHVYETHMVSTEPLVIYIPSFITPSEIAHLQSISAGQFRASYISDSTGQHRRTGTRTSQSTSVASDAVTWCIEQRALAFQGFDTPRASLEPLQLVRYEQAQEYKAHTDWFTSDAQLGPEFGGNRISSFFVYVSVSRDIAGGGTRFPLLDVPRDERWCAYVDCDAEMEDGLVFRPVQGNAVFWRNMAGGRGDWRTAHAGLVVQRGEKVGMNVWTREGVVDDKYRSGG